jgi:hypothetical protein
MVFSEGWLENLLRHDDGKTIVSCSLVERNHPKFGVFPGAIEANFGSSFKSLRWEKWLEFARIKASDSNVISTGGPYMPALFYKKWFEEYSFYPDGNIRLKDRPYSEVSMYGDEFLFSLFEKFGIRHVSTSSSLCYHFKEGERGTLFSQKMSIVKVRILRPIRRWASRLKRAIH